MSAGTDPDDYWTQNFGTTEGPSKRPLTVEVIEAVDPLGIQFGAVSPKAVPDALYKPLFGQPEPTRNELEQANGDPTKVPPLNTYAILDAAKIAGLPELLASSGLDFRCLFKDVAYDELKDVAPWVVRLEPDNSFTRNLFTRSDAGWHLWDNEPGVYIRSRGSLNDIWGHFRKFTKVQDEDGKSYYWRFWEPRWIADQLADMQPSQIDRFLPHGFQIIVISLNGKVAKFRRAGKDAAHRRKGLAG